LYRAASIPARYVYGTIEIPIEKAMNWVGVQNPYTCASVFASGGIPSKAITSGGKIVAIRLEHIWVEAWIDYIPSRGVIHKQGDTWVPLDPSFKQYTYTERIDLTNSVPFSTQSFLSQIQSSATINETEGYVTNVDSAYIQTALDDYQIQLQNYINQNMSTATVGDIIGRKKIKTQELKILPATLPCKTIVIGNRYSEIPDILRYKITFEIKTDEYPASNFSYKTNLIELISKKITLLYVPATPRDEQTINSYGGICNVPAYLIKMKPQLKVDGIVKASGDNIELGNQQTFNIGFISAKGDIDIVSNSVTAGAIYTTSLNTGKIPLGLLTSRTEKLANASASETELTDNFHGELLYVFSLQYFSELELFTKTYAKLNDIVYLKHPSEAMTSIDVNVSYLFSIPMSIEASGLSIDVDRDVYSVFSIIGNKDKEREFMVASGYIGSTLESTIFEQIGEVNSVSAIKILSIANQTGIPIYSITKLNASSVLPQLQISNQVRDDIANGINANRIVVIPKRNIQYNGWQGIGYILLDPDSGAGAYMLAGGSAGGWLKLSGIPGAARIAPVLLALIYKLKTIIEIWSDENRSFTEKAEITAIYVGLLVASGFLGELAGLLWTLLINPASLSIIMFSIVGLVIVCIIYYLMWKWFDSLLKTALLQRGRYRLAYMFSPFYNCLVKLNA
ncbi:MAG: transglutaminase domain-containing protein, partial [bacterium]